MSSELFVPLGRVSRRVKNLMRFGLACGVAYIVLIACKPFPLNTMYYGFMVEVAERTMLPACLVLFCMGAARFDSFERVRRNPVDEFRLNTRWLVFSTFVTALPVSVLFVVAGVLRESVSTPQEWTLCAIMSLQLLMMNASVTLFVWLLMNLGIAWGQILPPAIAIPIIADFCLKLMPGDLTRYVFYFWYPIGDSLTLVFIQQVVPFIGYCLLMGIANIAVFNCRDRLRMS